MLLFVYTTTRKRFEIFTCRYFKLSWNTTALSRSNCRNFSCSSIHAQTILDSHKKMMWSKLLCSFTASVRIETTCIDETTTYQNNRFHRLPSFSMRYLHNFVKPSVTAVVFRTITMQRLACSNWAGWILHNTWRLSRVRWRLVKTQNKDSFFYCFKVGLVFTICD